jgi:hypothetical protein
MMTPTEIAKHEASFLRVITTMSLVGPRVMLKHFDKVFVVECLSENKFLVSYELPPTDGGFQVRVPSEPRVEVNRTEMYSRAREWARTNRMAS